MRKDVREFIRRLDAVGTGVDCSVPSEFDLVPVNGNFRVEAA